MKVVLELQDQMSNVRKITVRHDIVIGRGADCNLRLSAPQISRRHCFLRVGRDGVSVTDLDSSNGTWVEGRRIDSGVRCDVQDGNFLSVGPIRFLVHVRQEAVSSELLAAGILNEEIIGNSPGTFPAASVGGDTTGADDRTNGSGPRTTATNPTRGGMPPLSIDSRAEIVDLGRRLAAHDERSQIVGQALVGASPRVTAQDSKSGHLTAQKSPPLNADSVDILQAGLLTPVNSRGASHNDTTSTDLSPASLAFASEMFGSPAPPLADVSDDSAESTHLANWANSPAGSKDVGTNPVNTDGIDPELRRFLSGL